jgi:hypothetical protein
MHHRLHLLILSVLLSIGLFTTTVSAFESITIDFYYSEVCGSCIEALDNVIHPIEEKFKENITILYKDVNINITFRDEMINYRLSYPSVVINDKTKIPTQNLTFKTLDRVITRYIENLTQNESFNENIINIPFIGRINISVLSLPILTITLGALDSFNPCAFFILIFLLNLLLYVRSRKRMLLIGGIFIFFSGLFYFLFIFILFNSLMITAEHIAAISLIAGSIAIIIGLLNIKDFFFFKKGPSLSIPDSKRPEIFKRMRNLVRTTSLPAVLIGTIILAITVNFYELLCTLGFPLIFTTQLNTYDLSSADYYLYIILYNIVYVIPLIFILLLFVFTLGRVKISEWSGRQLKLLSGIMIFSFGFFFIFDYQLLENILTPILLLGMSVVLTVLFSVSIKYFSRNIEKKEKKKGD